MSWEYRNGTSILRNDVSWDVAGRVAANTNPANAALGCAFQYDALDRLSVSQQGSPVTATQQFNYDKTGNRTNVTLNGSVTNYTTAAASNQLLALTGAAIRSYVYDAAGNPTTIGALVYTYNLANRLIKVMNGATTIATYKVNALGQRVEKVAAGVTTRYVYDEHGRLLGEYDGGGQADSGDRVARRHAGGDAAADRRDRKSPPDQYRTTCWPTTSAARGLWCGRPTTRSCGGGTTPIRSAIIRPTRIRAGGARSSTR